jgi:hypothetical protein
MSMIPTAMKSLIFASRITAPIRTLQRRDIGQHTYGKSFGLIDVLSRHLPQPPISPSTVLDVA